MSLSVRRTCATLAAICLLGLGACETSETIESGPGALPQPRAGVTPRLNASTFLAHGELLERRGELERAATQYRRALELTPDLAAARNRLGVTLNKLGRHVEATEQFRIALKQRPQLAYLHNNLGFSLYLQQRYDEAEPALARAVELQPSFRRARMNYGLVLARMGRYDKAWEQFAEAGTEADAHYNIAILQADAGDYKLAACSLEDALRCDPKLTAARDQLREISRLAAIQEATEAEAARIAAEAAEAQRLALLEAEARRLAAAEAEAARQAAQATTEAPVGAAEEPVVPAAHTTPRIVAASEAGGVWLPIAPNPVFDPLKPWGAPAPGRAAVEFPDARAAGARVESATLVALPQRAISASPDGDRIIRVLERLEAALTIADMTAEFPIIAPVFARIDQRLEELYEDLLYTVTVDGTWRQACLEELESLFGLTAEPY